ncbi:hypothetical protein [Pseudomonas prosekii]|uniref:hypothetical protein n=1 Tax=Pseudomonas prosekii TaxID=1148509 RepID=UPI0011EA7F9C|nr:hypothetical protein [Pseudomonas prosekii]
MTKFDMYLQRLTSISQIALVLIAVFTIFYSVIPLYQKELASEQLARIQIEQLRAEDRLGFLNASYDSKLKEIEKARNEIDALVKQSKGERDNLQMLNLEIQGKDALLAKTNKSLANTKLEMESANLKLLLSQKLKFIQAIEWYTLVEPLDDKCDMAMANWARPNDVLLAKSKPVGCDPYQTVKLAIHKVQQPEAKDSSGDNLLLTSENVRIWSSTATELMEKNKPLLADQMDYVHRDELIRKADIEPSRTGSKEHIEKSFKESVEASMAVLHYENEVQERNQAAIQSYIKLLREILK